MPRILSGVLFTDFTSLISIRSERGQYQGYQGVREVMKDQGWGNVIRGLMRARHCTVGNNVLCCVYWLYDIQQIYSYRLRHKTLRFFQWCITSLKNPLWYKVGWALKNSGNSLSEIFQIGPLGAEKFAFKDLKPLFLYTEIMANCIAILSTGCFIKNGLCFWGLWHLQFKVIFKCRECFGILMSSAFQYKMKLYDYHKKWH